MPNFGKTSNPKTTTALESLVKVDMLPTDQVLYIEFHRLCSSIVAADEPLGQCAVEADAISGSNTKMPASMFPLGREAGNTSLAQLMFCPLRIARYKLWRAMLEWMLLYIGGRTEIKGASPRSEGARRGLQVVLDPQSSLNTVADVARVRSPS